MSEPKRLGTVPVPNLLFDQLLPQLNDAELRLILIVLRSTLGWREGDDFGGWRQKRRDWLTNRQLVRRTGSSSASVSRAIQTLLDAGLIRVEAVDGTLLDTPHKRRRNLGRLYFAPGDMWKTAPPADIGSPRRTTNTGNNN